MYSKHSSKKTKITIKTLNFDIFQDISFLPIIRLPDSTGAVKVTLEGTVFMIPSLVSSARGIKQISFLNLEKKSQAHVHEDRHGWNRRRRREHDKLAAREYRISYSVLFRAVSD